MFYWVRHNSTKSKTYDNVVLHFVMVSLKLKILWENLNQKKVLKKDIL